MHRKHLSTFKNNLINEYLNLKFRINLLKEQFDNNIFTDPVESNIIDKKLRSMSDYLLALTMHLNYFGFDFNTLELLYVSDVEFDECDFNPATVSTFKEDK